jgi:hypothetical protein
MSDLFQFTRAAEEAGLERAHYVRLGGGRGGGGFGGGRGGGGFGGGRGGGGFGGGHGFGGGRGFGGFGGGRGFGKGRAWGHPRHGYGYGGGWPYYASSYLPTAYYYETTPACNVGPDGAQVVTFYNGTCTPDAGALNRFASELNCCAGTVVTPTPNSACVSTGSSTTSHRSYYCA